MCLEKSEKNWFRMGFFALLIPSLTLLIITAKWMQEIEDGLLTKVSKVDVVYYQTLVKQNHDKLKNTKTLTYEMYQFDKAERRAESITIAKELKAINSQLNKMNISYLTHNHDRSIFPVPLD